MKLYHYFNKGDVPCITLSDLSDDEANKIQEKLKRKGNNYDRRDYDGKYLYWRRIVEENIRSAFIEKGGNPIRKNPIYCILSESHEKNNTIYKDWFQNPDYIEIDIEKIDINRVSFTFGDSFIENHPEHHDQSLYQERVYTYREILAVIEKRGWPHDLVTPDSLFWVPRYIEAQVWCDL